MSLSKAVIVFVGNPRPHPAAVQLREAGGFNPERVVSLSPGLRAKRATLGSVAEILQPQRGYGILRSAGHNSFGDVCKSSVAAVCDRRRDVNLLGNRGG